MRITEHAKLWLKWLETDSEQKSDHDITVFEAINPEEIVDTLESFETIDLDTAWEKLRNNIEEETQKPKGIVYLIRPYFKYAAVLVLALSAFYLLSEKEKNLAKPNKNIASLIPIDIPVTLRMSNSGQVEFTEGSSQVVLKGKDGEALGIKNGKELAYFQNADVGSSVRHELSVPKGKTFKIKLSDGTRIYCDSETIIEYPSEFELGKPREVTIVGQAYFDVAKQNKDQFIVHTADMRIEVLGTQFNVKSYVEGKGTETVLVEGAVKVNSKYETGHQNILPGQRAYIGEMSRKMFIGNVNTYNHTAWISKKLIFNRTPFIEILKTLERRFAVRIYNERPILNNHIMTAKFDSESLEEILMAFSENIKFEYSVDDNRIVIY